MFPEGVTPYRKLVQSQLANLEQNLGKLGQDLGKS